VSSVQFVESHGGKVARRLIETKQRKSKVIYGHHRNKSNPIYEPGDVFLASWKPRFNGWTKKFIEPYQVLKQVSKTRHKVENLPAYRRRRIWRRFNVRLPEEDGTKSQQFEPSGSQQSKQNNYPLVWYHGPEELYDRKHQRP
jgi:hypothetical protein